MKMMRIVQRVLCGFYWVFLTVLLLVPNPASVVGLRRVPTFPWGDIGIHFTAFAILTLLVHASRWPRPVGWSVAVLLAYGVATETLQSFVPPRAVELKDYAENILGVLVGSAIYWGLLRIVDRALSKQKQAASKDLESQAIALDTAAQ
jgi:VanZ family protein